MSVRVHGDYDMPPEWRCWVLPMLDPHVDPCIHTDAQQTCKKMHLLGHLPASAFVGLGQVPVLTVWMPCTPSSCSRAITGIRANNNTCLCGSVPIPFLDPYLQPGWAVGTGLYAACPGNCTPTATTAPFIHPDWTGRPQIWCGTQIRWWVTHKPPPAGMRRSCLVVAVWW